MYDFNSQKQEWINVPVDGIDCISSKELMELSDNRLLTLFDGASHDRYSGWRNYQNKWRESLKLDTTQGKTILDFGCGMCIESYQFAQNNEVTIADINQESIDLAERILKLKGFDCKKLIITENYPFVDTDQKFDVFYCNGVLHHIPYAEDILKRAVELLNTGGEIRLMLYSDKGWEIATSTPISDTTQTQKFIRFFDRVGNYAEWYNLEKIKQKFSFLEVESFTYLTPDERYLSVILKP